ncbi:MAG: sigma-54-dependent Fis family transcriptional regulator [Phycisphaerales bacterium]|nr:MAG: sigma-54-dependent Fis family transcriptional regulator [Phycisphaerales bacterium]
MTERGERILVVDDSADAREVLQRTLSTHGFAVYATSGVAEAVRMLETAPIDLVITDLRMPRATGLDLIRHVHAHFEFTAVIMITGYASIESAVSAVKEGAEDYLPKPFTDEELLAAVRSALEKVRLRRAALAEFDQKLGEQFGIVGDSPPMRKVFRAIAKAASSDATVLVTGESGTGKELVSRAIHYHGARAAAPFVPVNCAGIPEGLVESELFGHVKGAFTGAVTTRAGFFITADHGTIFLDEIAELTMPMQAKLLRVIEDRQVQMVGAARPREVDVRIIAATNKELPALVKKGLFRDDLFFRLNIVTIELPPLRERGDDVLPLLHRFAAGFARQQDKPPPQFTPAAVEALRGHNWPGNVRELENVVHRMVVMADSDTIDVHDLPALMRFTAAAPPRRITTLAEVEMDHIRFVLDAVQGNKTRAAELLGIDRKTLREKLKSLESDE